MYFETRLMIRLRKEELKTINKIIKKNKGKFDNRSHFIRCAIISYINSNTR